MGVFDLDKKIPKLQWEKIDFPILGFHSREKAEIKMETF